MVALHAFPGSAADGLGLGGVGDEGVDLSHQFGGIAVDEHFPAWLKEAVLVRPHVLGEGHRAAGGGFHEAVVDLAGDGFIGDNFGVVVEVEHFSKGDILAGFDAPVVFEQFRKAQAQVAVFVEHADQGDEVRARRVRLKGAGVAGLAEWDHAGVTPFRGQLRPEGGVGGEHSVEEPGVVAVPVKVKVAVDGPEDLGAGSLRQALDEYAARQVLGLHDEIRGEVVLGEDFGQADDAGFGRGVDEDVVPGGAQGFVQDKSVEKQDVHGWQHSLKCAWGAMKLNGRQRGAAGLCFLMAGGGA